MKKKYCTNQDCEQIYDGVKYAFLSDFNQQQLEHGYDWIWQAIYEGTK